MARLHLAQIAYLSQDLIEHCAGSYEMRLKRP